MKKLAELQARLNALKTKGLGIVKAAEDEDRDLTDEEVSQIEAFSTEKDEIKAQIDGINQRQEARRAMEAISTGGGAERTPYGANATHDEDPALTAGFKSITEFAHAVRASCAQGAQADVRLTAGGGAPREGNQMAGIGANGQMMAAPTNFHTGGGDQGEGFNVPTQFRNEIFEVMEAVDEFGPMVDEERTAARRVEMLADEDTPWGAQGVQANWRAEGSQMSASRLNTDNRSVPLHEAYAFVLATGELLADAPRMQQRLTRRAGEALAWLKNRAMMRGTGAGQSLGWLNSSALITVAKESGQATDTVNEDNILKMFTRLAVLPGDSPRWLVNRNVLPQLMKMTIGDQPMWVSGGGLQNAPGGFLLGYPIMFTEHASTLGDLGDVQLMSPRGYYSVVRSTVELASSIHLYFDYNVEAFRWMTRFGGQTHLENPIDAPTEGGGAANSKSHFVTLEERV